MDNLTKSNRRKNMQNIRSKNTKMELKVRSLLHKKGLRFRIHTQLTGKPDIVFSSKKVVIFLDSCFFHKCPYHYVQPKSNLKYWKPKIERNTIRAKEVNKTLRKQGWKVIRFWEHQVKKDETKVVEKIISFVNE
ncbi:MAG TPA: very short patch repair endonuclease [Ignavibacteria bacterium]|nr:very short patch repair endonuclease [Ignavibacteria bacterium]HRF66371.1 very short patch repair endonuclease [Ignavibacteria bacterium]HRJ04349.1 very short patch repair endonuclease [Ignavibacteria bacterium]